MKSSNNRWGGMALLITLLLWAGATAAEAQVLSGQISGDEFGRSVAWAGDVNRDGLDDFLVGSPQARTGTGVVGRVTLTYGQAAGYPVFPVRTYEGEISGNQFGFAVSTAGDVNGDGYDDFLVGAPFYNTNSPGGAAAGRVYLYLGGSTSPRDPAWTFDGDLPGAHFGASLAGGFDFNDDGYDDFAVGAPDHNGPGVASGQVRIFFGRELVAGIVPAHTLFGDDPNWSLGTSLDNAGDVNKDGYGDLIAGAPQVNNFNSGRAVIWYGRESVLVAPNRTTLSGEFGGDAFGWAVSGAGDLNGDGYDDVFIGAPFHSSQGEDKGAVYVFRGGSFMDTNHDWRAVGTVGGHNLGYSVDGGFDISGDGVPDLAAGAPGANTPAVNSGEVRVFFGQASPSNVPDLTVTSNPPVPSFEADDRFGAAVRFVGSFNGDAVAELLSGAPFGNIASGAEAGYANLLVNPDFFTPVKLVSMDARIVGPAVEVRWQLADTEALSGLRVEAISGEQVRELHSGWLPAGTTSFTDPTPDPGRASYRLTAIERGGERITLGERSVDVTPARMAFAPDRNPFRDRVQLTGTAPNEPVTVSVWDLPWPQGAHAAPVRRRGLGTGELGRSG